MRKRCTGYLVLLTLALSVCGQAPAGAAAPRVQGPLTPGAVAVASADGYVFATSGDEVAVFKMSGGSRIKTFADQTGVSDLLIRNRTLFVLAAGAQEVNAFNTRDLVPEDSWDVSELTDIRSMAATPDALWFAYAEDDTHDALARLDTSTGTLTTDLATVPTVADIVATASPKRVYTLDRTTGQSAVHAFDIASAEPVELTGTTAGPDCTDGVQLAPAPGGASVWAACREPNAFAEWSTSNLATSPRTYAAGATPNAVAVSGDGSVFVGGTSEPGNDEIRVYDPGTTTAVATFPVDLGEVADGMVAVDYYGDRIYAVTTQGYLRSVDLRPHMTASPPAMHTNQAGDVLVQGTMFATVTSVQIEGTPASFTVLDDQHLTFYDPGLPNGLYRLTITNHWSGLALEGSSYAYLHVDPVPPSAPGPPEVTGTAVHSVSLSWALPASDGGGTLQYYRIRAYRDGHIMWERSVPASSAGATLTDVPSEYPYRFRVAAANRSGAGPWSALSDDEVTVPSAPMGPFGSITEFVDRQFRDVVGRPPDVHQNHDWVHQLRWDLAQPEDLVRHLRTSRDNQSNVDPVERLYLGAFGRPADAAGLRYWSTRSREGTTRASVAATFVGTHEFAQTYGFVGDRAYVERIYEQVLGRSGDPSGVDYWTSLLRSGRIRRSQVLVSFTESGESIRSQFAEVEAAAIPAMLLGRGPSQQEFEASVAAIDADGSAEALIADLIASAEYRDRIDALG